MTCCEHPKESHQVVNTEDGIQMVCIECSMEPRGQNRVFEISVCVSQ